jgi:hypothetical protein
MAVEIREMVIRVNLEPAQSADAPQTGRHELSPEVATMIVEECARQILRMLENEKAR